MSMQLFFLMFFSLDARESKTLAMVWRNLKAISKVPMYANIE